MHGARRGDTNFSAPFAYCNNDSYSFVYWEPGWNYGTPPVCRQLTSGEVVEKGLGNVFFTTAFMETVTIGWTCGDANDAVRRAECTDMAETAPPFGFTAT